MRAIDGLGELAGRYDTLLCDIWGVVHDGERAHADACAALAQWRDAHGPVILISNSPRPKDGVIEQMDGLGVPRAAWTAVVTSGDVTRGLLKARAPGPVLAIGPERDSPLYDGLELEFTSDVLQAAFISCTGLVDDETESPEDYAGLLQVAAERDLEMVCANPDRVVQRGDRLVPCAGALADVYEAFGGPVVMAGKPFAPIYEACFALAPGKPRERVLAIGDGLATDIAGANAQGLDALFIGGGVHGSAAGSLDGAALERALGDRGLTAANAMAALRW